MTVRACSDVPLLLDEDWKCVLARQVLRIMTRAFVMGVLGVLGVLGKAG